MDGSKFFEIMNLEHEICDVCFTQIMPLKQSYIELNMYIAQEREKDGYAWHLENVEERLWLHRLCVLDPVHFFKAKVTLFAIFARRCS